MATTYTTLFNLDVNKAIAQLKKFDRAKEKVLKSKAKNELLKSLYYFRSNAAKTAENVNIKVPRIKLDEVECISCEG